MVNVTYLSTVSDVYPKIAQKTQNCQSQWVKMYKINVNSIFSPIVAYIKVKHEQEKTVDLSIGMDK